jgi:hypothetical protein
MEKYFRYSMSVGVYRLAAGAMDATTAVYDDTLANNDMMNSTRCI